MTARTLRRALVGTICPPGLVLAAMLVTLGSRAQSCGLELHPVVPSPTGFSFSALAASPEVVVAVGSEGIAAVSRDGMAWQVQTIGTADSLDQIAWGNGRFLATATSWQREILESVDGLHWEGHPLGDPIAHLTFAGGWFVGASSQGFMASRDGRNWALRPYALAGNIQAITYGQGRFVAVGYQGALATSTDGYAWIEGTLPSSATFRSVAYGGGRFVTVGDGAESAVLTSSDGLSWAPANYPAEFSGRWVAYGNGRFVAQSWYPDFIVSSDGVSWEAVDDPAYGPNGPGALLWAFGHFLALGQTGILRSDPDGLNWAALDGRLEGGTLQAITIGGPPPRLVAVGTGCTVALSSDGVAWSTTRAAQSQGMLDGVAYGAGRYVAVGTGTYIGTGDTIYSSKDGAVWSQETPPNPGLLRAVTYGDRSFVAVGDSGVILTSTDGTSWVWRDTGYRQALYAITYGNGLFLAVGAGGMILASHDGAAWTSAQSPLGPYTDIRGITFGSGHFVATIPNMQGVLVSEDGLSWHQEGMALWHTTTAHYAKGRFIVSCEDSYGRSALAFSEDGLQWDSVPWRFPMYVAAWIQTGDSLLGVGSVENGIIAAIRADGCLPLLTDCRPNSGSSAGGDSVALAGTDLDRGVSAVFFGSSPAASFTVDSPGQITAVSPPHEPATVAIRMALADGSTADAGTISYTYVPARPVPQIHLVRMGGKSFKMKIKGDNFMPDSRVEIDGIAVPQTLYKSSTKIVAMGGDALRAMLPAGYEAAVTVRNTADWTVSDAVMVIRP